MDSRSRRRVAAALAGVIAVVALLVSPTPVRAATADTCTGGQSTTLAFPLTRVPSLVKIPFDMTGSASCVLHGSISWTGRGALNAGSSCAAMVALTGLVEFYLPDGVHVTSTASAAGPTAAQTWTYIDLVNGGFTATGGLSWLNTGELNECRRPTGTVHMTTTGSLSYEFS
jgi:hypothetical protein